MKSIENVVLIKINKTYKDNMAPNELYHATSVSWVARLGKTKSRDIKYYCAVFQNQIIEIYDFLGFEEELPKRDPSRYILKGQVASDDLRQKIIGTNVGRIHKGSGNPIKYTTLDTVLKLALKDDDDLITDAIVADQLVYNIHSFIQSKGFNYSISNIKNLFLSLRSKPFVIIAGISGTGKTKIAQLFAESIGATEANGQFKLIPVRPDWSDGSELLGFMDLRNKFQKGPLTKMIEHAIEHPELPHYVLLDEMNLARVEYYFSDVLSVMESRRRDNGVITSSNLLDSESIDRDLWLPENLYIIGTVNMDETTHPFSKKVLDRANTIEFNEIRLNNFDHLEMQEKSNPLKISNEHVASNFISLKDIYDDHRELIEGISFELEGINKILEPMNVHVGYRVRDEICFYMVHNSNCKLLSENAAFDYCLMQKILPRITGSDGRIDVLLNELFVWLSGVPYDAENIAVSVKYPRSAGKVAEMIRRYHMDGFTSFWIS